MLVRRYIAQVLVRLLSCSTAASTGDAGLLAEPGKGHGCVPVLGAG